MRVGSLTHVCATVALLTFAAHSRAEKGAASAAAVRRLGWHPARRPGQEGRRDSYGQVAVLVAQSTMAVTIRVARPQVSHFGLKMNVTVTVPSPLSVTVRDS